MRLGLVFSISTCLLISSACGLPKAPRLPGTATFYRLKDIQASSKAWVPLAVALSDAAGLHTYALDRNPCWSTFYLGPSGANLNEPNPEGAIVSTDKDFTTCRARYTFKYEAESDTLSVVVRLRQQLPGGIEGPWVESEQNLELSAVSKEEFLGALVDHLDRVPGGTTMLEGGQLGYMNDADCEALFGANCVKTIQHARHP